MVHTLSALLLLSFSEQIGSEAVHVTSPLNQFIMSTIMNANNSTTWSYGYRSLHIFLKSPQKTRLLTSCLDFWQYFHASLQLAKKDRLYVMYLLLYIFLSNYQQLFLPFMQKKEDFTTENQEGETLKSHWLVPDMFAFENVGFSMTVESIKYLACADCERGPIGWHDITDKTRFYIALERVEHKQLPQ